MRTSFFYLVILLSYTALYCAAKSRRLVTINSITLPLSRQITQARINQMLRESNPLINTYVFEYSDTEKLHPRGKILSAPTAILKQIVADNYVYIPVYTTKGKDRAGLPIIFGAIIVGTRDQTIADRLPVPS